MVDAKDLVIPVYLNQRIVFDLVAVLQGGIASVTQVSQTQSQGAGETNKIGASFGLSGALASLLKIDLTGQRDRTSSDESSTTTTQNRIHTPVSLFITLRSLLLENSYLKPAKTDSTFAPGDLVEFSTRLKRNPLVETLDSFMEMIDMFQVFSDKPRKGQGRKAQDLAQIKKQMGTLVSSLKSGDTLDLTTPPLPSTHRAVISLETQHLNDPTMSDLVDGTFLVVGKVTRCISESDDAISLNRKSAINRLPSSAFEQLKTALQGPELAEMSLPALEWEIPGPAIQVLPIAIFA